MILGEENYKEIIISYSEREWKPLDTIDIPTKCKLITAFVRNDRFCDGVLIEVFESGVILKILKSIQSQLKF